MLIVHPMKYESRRMERTKEAVAKLSSEYEHVIDLTHFEARGLALEGKGSIVFHHRARCFLIARSERSCPEVIDYLVTEWNKLSKVAYRAITFEAWDEAGSIIYHTDCMLSLLGNHAFICADAIKDEAEKSAVLEILHPLKPILLTHFQISQMAANAQCVRAADGKLCVI